MASEGPNYPGTVSDYQAAPEDDVGWSQEDRVKAADSSYAYFLTFSANQYTWILKCTNFGFSIPVDATIDGIVVSNKVYSNNSNSYKDYRVQLYDDDGNLAGDNKNNSSFWPTTAANRNYGGATDTWNITPTPAMINNSNFGVAHSARSSKSALGYNDYIRVTVYYTEAAGGGDVKTVNGIAFADVKTRNGIAIANVKTINGISTT